MSTYQLTPVEAPKHSASWRVSTLPPEPVLVNAESEKDARAKVTLATAIAAPRIPGGDTPIAPWRDPDVVRCAVVAERDVPEGVIEAMRGRIIVIADQ